MIGGKANIIKSSMESILSKRRLFGTIRMRTRHQQPTDEEERYLIVGMIGDIGWTAVVTYRDETTRIISVRRSRFKEVEVYDHRKRIR